MTILRSAMLSLTLAALPMAAQAAEPAARQEVPYSLAHSSVFTLQNAAGDSYRIMVAWPDGAPPATGWPALYVLDGADNFAVFALTARRLARAGARSGIEPGIIVGIDAGQLVRRVRDYTPPVPGYRIPANMPAAGRETGGGDAFLDFLQQRVMPEVQRRWRVDKTRETLAGHSFGGVIALHAFLTRPNMFDSVAAVSPSLWFGNGWLTREFASPRPAAHSRRLLVAEGDAGGFGGVRPASPAALVEQLHKQQPTTQGTFLNLPGQTHGTTFLAAMTSIIRLAFGKAG